jgi:hypothetical protein
MADGAPPRPPTATPAAAASPELPRASAAGEPPADNAPLASRGDAPAAVERLEPSAVSTVDSADLINTDPVPNVATDIPLPARIYGPQDVDVVPPRSLVSNQLGRLPRGSRPDDFAMIELVVSESGTVESARVTRAPLTLADAELMTMSLSAAKAWRFQPARKLGEPVKYRQRIPVALR